MSRSVLLNEAMSEEEKKAEAEAQPQEGASGSLDVPAEGEAVEQGLPKEFARDEEVKVLVAAAQDGDEAALNELFTRYYHVLVQTAQRRLGPRLKAKETPDDLAQTTFREATRDFKAYRYRGEGSLLRWLIQILQNKIRDRAEFYSAGKRDLSRERSLEPAPTTDGEKQKAIEAKKTAEVKQQVHQARAHTPDRSSSRAYNARGSGHLRGHGGGEMRWRQWWRRRENEKSAPHSREKNF